MARFRTRDWSMVQVQGADAQGFLHRICSIDVQGLASGFAVPGLLLDGTSNIFAQFVCIRVDANSFHLLTSTENLDSLYSELEKMHFSEDLSIHSVESISGAEFYAGNSPETPVSECIELDSEFPAQKLEALESSSLCFRKVPLYTRDWFALIPESEEATPAQIVQSLKVTGYEEESGEEFWETLRIGHLVPERGKEWQPGKTKALDSGFRRWLDRKKGCYPGQEAVEKSLNLGHPAKALVRIEFENLDLEKILAPQPVIAAEGDSAIGELTSISHKMGSQGKSAGLAMLRWKFRDMKSAVYIVNEIGDRVVGKILP